MSLEAAVSIKHLGGSGRGHLVADPEMTIPLGTILSDQVAVFRERTACSAWRGVVEKVSLNNVHLHYARLASLCQPASSERLNNHGNKTKKLDLNVTCWNVWTMLDKVNNNRPECHSALIAHDLSRLDVDIATLSEIRFIDRAAS